MKKDRSITIRIPDETYKRLLKEAIDISVKENRIVKLSEIIRKKLEN
jgi:predicted DNA-binding protein